MSSKVLEEFTRQYINAQVAPEITFAWQGGEPTLMGLDFFSEAVEYQNKYKSTGVKINNAIQTNGTLLDSAWCSFFKENHFLVGLSLDGPRKFHDVYRRGHNDKPTFDNVIKGLNQLKKSDVEFNILACVSAGNVHHPLEVYRFFRDRVGAQFIQFIPIVERRNENSLQSGELLTDSSITGNQYSDFLIAIFDEWVRKDVGKVFVQIFDTALGRWVGARGGLCVFEETCGLGLAMEHNGDLYSCDHYVESAYYLGNIMDTSLVEMVGSSRQKKFGNIKRDKLPSMCRVCEVRFACNGGCPKNRIVQPVDGESTINHLCEGYKAFFGHINDSMILMAKLLDQKRPPSDVMRIMALNDRLRSRN
jgi:uncharacterized protein